MRNSRKYINPSINGSRNIFTSYDDNLNSINLSLAISTPGIESLTNAVTVSGLTVPVSLRISASIGGSYHSSSYCNVYKNNILIQTINTPSSFPTTTINQQFYNGDTIQMGFYVDFGQSVSYTLNIFRLTYSINNPISVVAGSIDTVNVSI
jgi:hypothetical protein